MRHVFSYWPIPADQAVTVRSQLVDDGLNVVDLERDVSQPEFVGHRRGRSRLVVGVGEASHAEPLVILTNRAL